MDGNNDSKYGEASDNDLLLNLKHMLTDEFSLFCSEIAQARHKFIKSIDAKIPKLIDHIEKLNNSIIHMEEIIEGKEIEIYGLRRQVQCFSLGQPVCSMCSQSIHVLPDEKEINLNKALKGYDMKELFKLNLSNKLDNLDSATSRKRTHNDLSVSSIDSLAVKANKPTVKRFCVNNSQDTTGLISNESRKNINERNESHLIIVSQMSESLDESSRTIENSPKSNKDESTATISAPCVPGLSPPSRSYDASLAIQNAVNQFDLLDYEATFRQSELSDISKVRDNMPVSTANKVDQFVKPMTDKKSNTAKSSRRRYHSVICHKPTCRHYRPSNFFKPIRNENCFNPDETDVDTSLPSDFLNSDASLVTKPNLNKRLLVTLLEKPNNTSTEYLPSVGGSPDSNLLNSANKNKIDNGQNCLSDTSLSDIDRKSKDSKQSSTPQGFWDLEIEHNSDKENHNDEHHSRLRSSVRRRRPLILPTNKNKESSQQEQLVTSNL